MNLTWNHDRTSFTWDMAGVDTTRHEYGLLQLAFVSPENVAYPFTITQIDIWGYRPGPCLINGRPVYAPLATRVRITLNDQSATVPENMYLDKTIPPCQSPNCIQWVGEDFVLDRPLVLTAPHQTIYFLFYNSICPNNVLLIQRMLFHIISPPIYPTLPPPPAPSSSSSKRDPLHEALLWGTVSLIVVLFIIIIVILLVR